MSIRTIAIVGCGAAGTTFYKSLVEECIQYNLNSVRIIFFEHQHKLGTGKTYQDDFEKLLINHPAQLMSANPDNKNEYCDWLQQKGHLSAAENNTQQQPIYTSRKLFGTYLHDSLETTVLRASLNHIQTNILYEEVTSIVNSHPFLLQTQTKKSIIADAIILCTGANSPPNPFQLTKIPQYIHNVYPLRSSLNFICPGDRIGIIGNSLTTIDIMLALKNTAQNYHITLWSEEKSFPSNCTHQPTYLTEPAIHALLKQHHNILPLNDVLNLLRQELQTPHQNWQHLPQDDFPIIPTTAIIPSIQKVAELIWKYLSPIDKQWFKQRCEIYWQNQNHALPTNNAQLFLSLAEENHAFYQTHLKSITFDNKLKTFTAIDSNGNSATYDWILNALDPSLHIKTEESLLYQLIHNGKARTSFTGGLDLDPTTSALIDKYGEANPRLRCISGDSQAAIGRKAKRVAVHLVECMRK